MNLWADFAAPLPAADDVVSVTFDRIPLFAVPFSAFRPGHCPGTYWLLRRELSVRLDFQNGQIFVTTPRIGLPGIDNTNGIDIELLVGDAAAAENILLKPWAPRTDKKWVYRRADTHGDPL